MSDQTLAAAAAAGSREAFDELSGRYRNRLVRFVQPKCRRLGVEADDIVQDALLKAWKAIDRFDTDREFSSWIYSITHRQTIDEARRDGRRKIVPIGNNDVDPADPSSAAPIAAVDAEMDQSDGGRESNIWRVARDILPEDAYAAMWLRYGEGFSPTAVARTLGRSAVAIRVSLHRSKKTLHQQLEQTVSRRIDPPPPPSLAPSETHA